ncbi:MAG TPA: cytochrome D1 domain-containing protein [Usitatibacter sp.]|jgi:DNA-binding beta-propeller fold protein YncE|nr:cytochrome D1 domain-containing protein [Usitatibacter sp.]
MKTKLYRIVSVLALVSVLTPVVSVAAEPPLKLIGRTDVPGFEGDFDHFAADVKGNRLFLAGEDKGTLEVFELKSGKHVRTVTGLEEPHSILFLPEKNRLIVSNSGEGMTKVLDAKTFKVVNTIKLTPGADTMRQDPSTRDLWIVTGGKNAARKLPDTTVAVVDAATGRQKAQVKFDTDFTEAIAFEKKGSRAFINVTGKDYVAVVDRKSHKVVQTWPVKEGKNNAPIGLDEHNKRLFLVTRKPFRFVVLDTDTGRSIASFDAPQRTNELVVDRANHRIYLAGDDYVSVIEQKGADQYEEVARVPSDKGAKTAILVPELHRLYVAVAGKGGTKAGVLQYEVLSAH